MLYLGQICKIFLREPGKLEEIKPAIFLGFKKTPSGFARTAEFVYLKDGIPTEVNLWLDAVSVIRIKDDAFKGGKTLTGKRVYRGPFCKGVVNEHIILKVPDNAKEILKDAEKLLAIL